MPSATTSRRSHQVHLLSEEAGAGRDLGRRRAAVVAAGRERVTEHGVRHEGPRPRDARVREEGIEPAAGDVGGQRDAGSRRAEPAGRLGDEQDVGVERAVRLREDVDVIHPSACRAGLDPRDEAGDQRGEHDVAA